MPRCSRPRGSGRGELLSGTGASSHCAKRFQRVCSLLDGFALSSFHRQCHPFSAAHATARQYWSGLWRSDIDQPTSLSSPVPCFQRCSRPSRFTNTSACSSNPPPPSGASQGMPRSVRAFFTAALLAMGSAPGLFKRFLTRTYRSPAVIIPLLLQRRCLVRALPSWAPHSRASRGGSLPRGRTRASCHMR